MTMRPTARRVKAPRPGAAPSRPLPRGAPATRLLLAGGGAILAIAACCLMVIVSSGSESGESQRQPDVVTRPGAKDAPVLPARPAARPSEPGRTVEEVATRDAPPPVPPRSYLEGRVASDAAGELRRVWDTVKEECPAGNGDAADGSASAVPEFVFTFDADGDEIGRSPSENRGSPPGLGACFLARHDLRLRVPAPGREIQVTIRAPVL